jgi:hypothetical protein
MVIEKGTLMRAFFCSINRAKIIVENKDYFIK